MATHLLFALALLAAGWARADARQTPAHQQAADLAHELMSPFCPGKLLADCTSSQAFELREVILRRLEAGETVQTVKADLVRQYGASILGAPEPKGLGLLAWLIPVLIALVSATAVVRKVLHAAHRPAAAGGLVAAGTVDPGVLADLDDELRDLD